MGAEKKYKLTAEGSLGVLALGDIGLKLWREQRTKEGKNPYDKTDSNKNTDENDGEKVSQ